MKNNEIKKELYALGELPENWTLEGDREGWDREAEALKESNREILEKYKPADMAAKIALRARRAESEAPADNEIPFPSKSETSSARRFAVRTLIPLAAAAVLALALLLPMRTQQAGSDALDYTRAKGATETVLHVYRKTADDSEMLESGSSAVENDVLQLAYRTGTVSYGLIISIDGNGVVTRHFPEDGEMSPRLTSGGEQYLPWSYELDDAPEFETFYLISSDLPFSTEKVMDAAAAAARDSSPVLDIPALLESAEIPGAISQIAIPIRKDTDHED